VALAAITAISALVLAEDPSTGDAVARHLFSAGFLVHHARSEDDAVRRASETSPDLVILDLLLEEGPGTNVCRRLRELPTTEDIPILALTGSHDVATKVKLLELGCDDCLVRPCEPEELLARVHALLRRRRNDRLIRRIGPLRVHLVGGDAWIGTRALDLTAGERAILSTLARAYPSVAQRAALDRLPWRAAADVSSNVTEVLVARLRQKLAAAGGGVEIRTVRRTGYRFETGDATEAGA
jgi:DNA-binding response OmpR family regulator